MFEVFFDVETKKMFQEITTNDAGDLGVSIVSAYERTVDENGKEITGMMHSFWEKDFANLWELFGKADRIIGFNTKFFDVPALQPYTSVKLAELPHFDIMEHFKNATGRRISLNALAHANVGEGKVDKGENAVIYWKSGDPESLRKLQYYCEADVAITRDIYDVGVKNKQLIYIDSWNNPVKVPVNFTYPPPPDTQQMGLF